MELGAANRSRKPRVGSLGLYAHVPFCSTSCDFCAFYQEQSDRAGILSYLEGMERESALARIGSRGIDTMFWGGGTPGLLPAKDLNRLAETLIGAYGTPREEWTVELAPSSVKRDKLVTLKDAGVTRISMGIQSLNPRLLEALGRQHSVKQIHKAYELIRNVGFPVVNLDLIFAIPGQSEEEWRADLRAALAMQPEHLSTYCLTFEEDTALYVKLQQGKVSLDPERERRYYFAAWEETEAAGLNQYEISNYAKPGMECVHNVGTWRMGEWLGLGPSAASQFGGWRYSNPPDLRLWRTEAENGRRGGADRSRLTPELLLEDAMIFGLRMNAGVDLDQEEARFGARLPIEARRTLDLLVAEGKASRDGARVRLTAEGRLLADAIGEFLLALPAS